MEFRHAETEQRLARLPHFRLVDHRDVARAGCIQQRTGLLVVTGEPPPSSAIARQASSALTSGDRFGGSLATAGTARTTSAAIALKATACSSTHPCNVVEFDAKPDTR